MEQAVDLLRKRGLAKAAKKSGRIAAEGKEQTGTPSVKPDSRRVSKPLSPLWEKRT
jgi:hypothetical protein